MKQRVSMALQIGIAACILVTVSGRDAVEAFYFYSAFLNLYIIAVFLKLVSTGLLG